MLMKRILLACIFAIAACAPANAFGQDSADAAVIDTRLPPPQDALRTGVGFLEIDDPGWLLGAGHRSAICALNALTPVQSGSNMTFSGRLNCPRRVDYIALNVCEQYYDPDFRAWVTDGCTGFRERQGQSEVSNSRTSWCFPNYFARTKAIGRVFNAGQSRERTEYSEYFRCYE